MSAEKNVDEPLFSEKENMSLMSEVQNMIERDITSRAPSNRSTLDFFRRFTFIALRDFQIRSKEYDEYCGYNKSTFRERYADILEKYDGSEHRLCNIFLVCYRFVCELDFVTPEGVGNSLGAAKNELVGLNFDDYPGVKQEYDWVNTLMPMYILKASFNQQDLKGVKDFGGFVKSATDKFEEFEVSFSKKLLRIEDLESRLQSGEQDLNFALLNKGFLALKNAKVSERVWSLVGMLFFGGLLVVAPLVKLFGEFSVPANETVLLVGAFTLVGFELLLIYFFRIFLINFRSLSQQILQIDLRMTLCSFIESYSNFAVKTREVDKDILSRFEQIIFSEVSFGDSQLPSAFEGVEHVSSVFGKIRAK